MKIKPEYIFGGLTAAAGLAVAWHTLTQGPASTTVVSVPPLQMPNTGYASDDTSQPSLDILSFPSTPLPASQATQGIVLPQSDLPSTTATQSNQPYLTSNFGPSHVAAKAHTQARLQQAALQNAQQNGGCSCNSPCGSCNIVPNSQAVSPAVISYGQINLSTIDSTPQPSYGNTNNDILSSAISQYHSAAAVVPIVASMNGAGSTYVGNVPATYNDHLDGYGA